jgi:hypothetical protein
LWQKGGAMIAVINQQAINTGLQLVQQVLLVQKVPPTVVACFDVFYYQRDEKGFLE